MGDVSSSCKCHRYPVEVSSPCVWLYFRFPLLFREVEEVMLERGVIAFHETVRRLCVKFGQAYTDGPLPRRPRSGDEWDLDKAFVKINGKRHYLWCAVDQDGNVLDILFRSSLDAKQFLPKLTKKQRRVPRVLITDKLRSYGVAHRHALSGAPLANRPEQPGGELPPAHQTA